MQNLDPTYLRYIYDNLIKGSVNPDNDSELPDGLIGLYEEAFEEYLPVLQRQQLLQRFALFALLKKEVSSAFVAEVLGESENSILEFINTYASWFNSPEPGKFQLYHERLKVYVLQKFSEKEIQSIHEKLIARLEIAIEEQQADEFERYALEFLSEHLYIDSMLSKDGQKLIDLGYSQSHWQRQLKISKGYTWTKNGLKAVMTWASKFNNDEVIECGLQMVDLYHQEQNAAPQIVASVAEGDFDSALKRIEQFGGNDKEGLQRKFILYMLCLMELTLLESKDKPFRKEGIEKLLKHLDEQLPVNHLLLNWNDFFSSYLVFLIISEWNTSGWRFDYSVIINRSNKIEGEWLKHNVSFNNFQLKLTKQWTTPFEFSDKKLENKLKLYEQRSITFEEATFDIEKEFLNSTLSLANFWQGDNYRVLFIVSLISNGEVDKVDFYIDQIRGQWREKKRLDTLFKRCAIKLAERRKYEFAFEFSERIIEKLERFECLIHIALSKRIENKTLESDRIISSVRTEIRSIKNKQGHFYALCEFLELLSPIFSIEKSNSIIFELLESQQHSFDPRNQSIILKNITKNSLISSEKIEVLTRCMNSSYFKLLTWVDQLNKNKIDLKSLSIEKVIENIETLNQVENKCLILLDFVRIFHLNDHHSFVDDFIKRAEIVAGSIHDETIRGLCEKEISKEYLRQGKTKKCIEIIERISSPHFKYNALAQNSTILFVNNNTEFANQLMQRALDRSYEINIEMDRLYDTPHDYEGYSPTLKYIAIELIKQNRIKDGLEIIDSLIDTWKCVGLFEASFILLSKDRILSLNLLKEGLKICIDDVQFNYPLILGHFEKSIVCLFDTLAKMANIDLAQDVSQRIHDIGVLSTAWDYFIKEIDVLTNNDQLEKLYSSLIEPDNRNYFLNGVFNNLILIDYNFIFKIIPELRSISQWERALQLHALNQLFFEEISEEKIQRFNRTLNLQWAIDIKKELDQLPN